MRLIFGKGDILVTECGDSEQRHILMEHGRGVFLVGKAQTHIHDRMPGAIIPDEALEDATVTLSFDNPVSCGVVLEKILVSMVSFKKAGKTIGEENADLAESISELWEELVKPFERI